MGDKKLKLHNIRHFGGGGGRAKKIFPVQLCGIYALSKFQDCCSIFWDCLTEVYLDTGEGETELFDRLEEIIEEEKNVQDEEFDEVFYNCKFSQQVKEIVKSRDGLQLKSHLEEIKYILEVGK